MIKFNDLIIKSNKYSTLTELIEKFTINLPAEWLNRKENVEHYTLTTQTDSQQFMCVESPKIDGRRGLVWLRFWENTLKVTNITPVEPGSLSYEQYNSILDSFYHTCILPNLDDRFIIKYDNTKINFEEFIGEENYKKLNAWEKLCNHSTGNTHPMDFERWTDFVISAHKTNSKLTPSLLNRWLVEDRNWSDDSSLTLKIILDYEYSRDLLDSYDR